MTPDDKKDKDELTMSDLDKVAGGAGRPLEADHASMEPDSLLSLGGVDGPDMSSPGDSIVISADKDAHNPGEKAEMGSPGPFIPDQPAAAQAVKDTGEAKADMGFKEAGTDEDWNDG
ncbi:MAG: hypothetical protein ACJZ9F_10600 [Rhodospirillaceae bacterium]